MTDPTSTDDNKLIAERRAKLAKLRDGGNAFPNDFRRTAMAGDLQAEFGGESKEALAEQNRSFAVAGRLIRNRGSFLLIQDGSDTIQLYIDRKGLDEATLEAIKSWDLGDIVASSGVLCKSGKGDLYINMETAQLLTKALRPLPDKYHGLADQETRYRQRYVDLITNPEVRETFQIRSRVIAFVRSFLDRQGFMEVETPMLHPIPGGATARPFATHHNALDMPMFMRIAPELYLKRLTVGGFEKVYEINRNFRNEGLSTRHNPEFTMLEFYWAYADYKDAMDLTEQLLRELSQAVLGTTVVPCGEEQIDFNQPFDRMTVTEAILAHSPAIQPEQLDSRDSAAALLSELGVEVKAGWGLGRIHMEIFEETAEDRLIQPTFITEYPTEVSPLARRKDRKSVV